MVTSEDIELTSSHEHTKSTATCATVPSEKDLETIEQLCHIRQTRKRPN